jgi:3',5'-cyclic-AMP phosphodiesterase
MRFIYLADTHIGGSDNTGYTQQTRYLRYFSEIMACLKNYIKTSGDIDFVMHGGDIIEQTTPETITAAAEFFGQLPCPTYLALGNHDLTDDNSVELWLKYAPQFFPTGNPDFRLTRDGVQLDVLLCNWGVVPALWKPEEAQVPWLSAAQFQQLDTLDSDCSTQLIVTHSPMYGIPPEQHGGTYALHAPVGDFCEKMGKHLQSTALVLGAHTHMNMALKQAGCYFATVAAFSEMPFELKIVEVTHDKLSMKTVNLSSMVSFRGES